MDRPKINLLKGAAAGVAGTLLLLATVGLIVVATGAYNVSATSGHTAGGRWTLDTTMRNSVRQRASAIAVPADFDALDVSAGAREFKAMCEHCHGGPGVRRSEWAAGMVPQPPNLAHAAREWKPNEIFWIVKHGVKMSGMPAFGPTHDDETLWRVAAFVRDLPAMTPGQYQDFPSEGHGLGTADHSGHAH